MIDTHKQWTKVPKVILNPEAGWLAVIPDAGRGELAELSSSSAHEDFCLLIDTGTTNNQQPTTTSSTLPQADPRLPDSHNPASASASASASAPWLIHPRYDFRGACVTHALTLRPLRPKAHRLPSVASRPNRYPPRWLPVT